MKPIGATSNQQPLRTPGARYFAKVPIVVEKVDALRGWKLYFVKPWKRGVLWLALRASFTDGSEDLVNCYCSADLFRVARETHVI